jgi:hypothetical protein
MTCFDRGFPLVGVALVAAAAVVIAALTSWWVLLALVPLVMMVGCMAMMAAAVRVIRCGGPRQLTQRHRCHQQCSSGERRMD